jgi:hypothetical protein
VAAELAIVAVLIALGIMTRALLRYVEMRQDHDEAMQAIRPHRCDCDGTCTGTVTRLVKPE